MHNLLNGVIRFSLSNRLLIIAVATLLLVLGGWQLVQLPIDVFPDLNRPRVVVMVEAPGLAPEEVESLVTLPIETAINGATGVEAVRSSSGVGIAVITVEFAWGTDINDDRQVVTERLAVASEQLPEGIRPQLAPISSIMGQIALAAVLSRPTATPPVLTLDAVPSELLVAGPVPAALRTALEQGGLAVSAGSELRVERPGERWLLVDGERPRQWTLVQHEGQLRVHQGVSPMELRTLADWVIRQRLLTIEGVSQVFVMGGERKQFQVLVNPDLLRQYGVSMHEVEQALQASNQNATGGYLEQKPYELLVRAIGRITSIDELRDVIVKQRPERSVALHQVATVREGPQVKRGDSAAWQRDEDGEFFGGPAVVLTINKQPGADTRRVSEDVVATLRDLEAQLPPDVVVLPSLYQQRDFIDRAIANVVEALRDGSILVLVILFLFLMNLRTTFITLTAIPLSIVITGLVFRWFGLSINTMTLGGIAVAIGELVDDAIVDVENIFRRLRENRQKEQPEPALRVVFEASVEIRNSIIFGTMIVVLVFIPLFALSGIEGRLFTPLAVAYIVSIISSLFVSLTVTPVLSYWLLGRERDALPERESWVVHQLKRVAGVVIRLCLRFPRTVLAVAAVAVLASGVALVMLQRDFLPPFDEGAVQVNVLLPPGASLETSNDIASQAEQQLRRIEAVQSIVRKTGRAELDEHAEGVNVSELVLALDPEAPQERQEILQQIRARLDEVPGIVTSVEQPISHLISHMLSGVRAQVAIKVFGDDLEVLRRVAAEMQAAIAEVPGVEDLQVEPQVLIPQLRIEVDGHRLKQYGLTRGEVTELIETAMGGRVVSEVLQGQRKFDLLVRLDEPYREDLERLRRLTIELPSGGTTKLASVARIYKSAGPNTINREQVQRRIVLQCNVAGRGLVDVVQDIRQKLLPIEQELPAGYHVEYGGQFESQQSASRTIAVLFVFTVIGMYLVLYTLFRSGNLALQVMIALPMALIGSVAALYVTGQTLTIAAMVGFISLCGIASRNGILLINHYLHLVQYEGEQFTQAMIVRAGQERLAPVLMTALTSGIGLLPLALAAGEPGKEILYPVATVIIGGLMSSTLLEFLVRPALFWLLGTKSAARALERQVENHELHE